MQKFLSATLEPEKKLLKVKTPSVFGQCWNYFEHTSFAIFSQPILLNDFENRSMVPYS